MLQGRCGQRSIHPSCRRAGSPEGSITRSLTVASFFAFADGLATTVHSPSFAGAMFPIVRVGEKYVEWMQCCGKMHVGLAVAGQFEKYIRMIGERHLFTTPQ